MTKVDGRSIEEVQQKYLECDRSLGCLLVCSLDPFAREHSSIVRDAGGAVSQGRRWHGSIFCCMARWWSNASVGRDGGGICAVANSQYGLTILFLGWGKDEVDLGSAKAVAEYYGSGSRGQRLDTLPNSHAALAGTARSEELQLPHCRLRFQS